MIVNKYKYPELPLCWPPSFQMYLFDPTYLLTPIPKTIPIIVIPPSNMCYGFFLPLEDRV